MWQTPKTDWRRTDAFAAADHARIRENLAALAALTRELYTVTPGQPGALYAAEQMDAADDTSLCTAQFLNAMETAVAALAQSGYDPGVGAQKTWRANARTPLADDWNRIEGACGALHTVLTAQAAARPALALTLGGGVL